MDEQKSARRLQQVMDDYANRAFPNNANLWPALKRSLTPAAKPRRNWLAAQTALGACLLLTLVAVAVFAVPALDRKSNTAVLISQQPISPSATPTMPTVLTQTAAGYTMTLYPLIADHNEIVISYTLQGPQGTPIDIQADTPDTHDALTLVDSNGREYRHMITNYPDYDQSKMVAVSSNTFNRVEIPTGRGIMTFNGDKLGSQATADFQLKLYLYKEALVTPVVAGQLYSHDEVAGPFTFNFTMPIDQEVKSEELQQTRDVWDDKITLQRIIVTASSARIYAHTTPVIQGTQYFPNLKLTLPGLGSFDWNLNHMTATYNRSNAHKNDPLTAEELNSYLLDFQEQDFHARSFLNYNQQWMVDVNPGTAPSLDSPWRFTFPAPTNNTNTANASPTTTSTSGMNAKVTIKQGEFDAWVRVIADGAVVFGGTMPAGSIQAFHVNNFINVSSGRGDLVDVAINDVDKGWLGDSTHMTANREWDSSGNERISTSK